MIQRLKNCRNEYTQIFGRKIYDRSNLKLREKIKQINLSNNKTPKLNYREATKYYQGIMTQNNAFGKNKI